MGCRKSLEGLMMPFEQADFLCVPPTCAARGSHPRVQTASSQSLWRLCPHLPGVLCQKCSVNELPLLLDLPVGLPRVHEEFAHRLLQAF